MWDSKINFFIWFCFHFNCAHNKLWIVKLRELNVNERRFQVYYNWLSRKKSRSFLLNFQIMAAIPFTCSLTQNQHSLHWWTLGLIQCKSELQVEFIHTLLNNTIKLQSLCSIKQNERVIMCRQLENMRGRSQSSNLSGQSMTQLWFELDTFQKFHQSEQLGF